MQLNCFGKGEEPRSGHETVDYMFGMEPGNETEAGSGPGSCTVECPVLTSASVGR